MVEHPIIFNGDMVRAILDGRKTQTRRVIKPQPPKEWKVCKPVINDNGFFISWRFENKQDSDFGGYKKCPYGKVGDKLWVRETWAVAPDLDNIKPRDLKQPDTFIENHGNVFTKVCYREAYMQYDPWTYTKWRPSIFMPKWACRLWLEITNIRVERVQDISASDILEEGTLTRNYPDLALPKTQLGWLWDRFSNLWDSINAKRLGFGWDMNPWVWVLEFKKI